MHVVCSCSGLVLFETLCVAAAEACRMGIMQCSTLCSGLAESGLSCAAPSPAQGVMVPAAVVLFPAVVQRRAGPKGFGLYADQDIGAGEFVIQYVGEVLEEEEYLRRKHYYIQTGQRHYYFMNIGNGEVIDACRKVSVPQQPAVCVGRQQLIKGHCWAWQVPSSRVHSYPGCALAWQGLLTCSTPTCLATAVTGQRGTLHQPLLRTQL